MSNILLLPEEIETLHHLVSSITVSPSENPELYGTQTKELSPRIHPRIQHYLHSFAQHGSPTTGYILFRGFPSTPIPPTPPKNTYHIGETTTLAHFQALFLQSISEMIAYEAEGHGRLFQDIVPNPSMSTAQTSLGSQIELEIHTEQAFSNLRPDFLGLACLRGDPDAYTYILPVNLLLDHLTIEEQALLRQPLWTTGVDLSFKLHGKPFLEGDLRGPMAILYGPTEDPHLRFDQDLMRGLTQEAEQMIKKIVAIYYEHRLRHRIEPGEILILDNRRAVHGRSPFYPRYDGQDRFLIRCLSRIDYESTAYARPAGGRVVAAIYS